MEIDADEARAVAFFADKCLLHEKGIKGWRMSIFLAGKSYQETA